MLNEEYCRLADPEAIAALKLESLYKTIDAASPLIQRRVVPTLVRLCSSFSASYRSSSVKGTSSLAELATSGIAIAYFTSLKSLADHHSKEMGSHVYLTNVCLLVQSVNTLTYLVELSAELQMVAGSLEQIVPTLALNVVEAYAAQSLSGITLGNGERAGGQMSHKQSRDI